LSSWSDVNAIATFRNVSILRLAHIPLFAGKGASEVRPFVIGRIAALLLFNGSNVSVRERNDAEKIYLRLCYSEKSKAEAGAVFHTAAEEVFKSQHPRYQELYDKYAADIIPSGSHSEGGSSMGAELLNIVINNVSFSLTTGQQCEPITRRIPGSLTVGRLKLMIKQLYGVDPAAQQLSIRNYKDAVPTLLDDDDAALRYFGASDGSNVYVNETDIQDS
jgi:hypothetical protein